MTWRTNDEAPRRWSDRQRGKKALQAARTIHLGPPNLNGLASLALPSPTFWCRPRSNPATLNTCKPPFVRVGSMVDLDREFALTADGLDHVWIKRFPRRVIYGARPGPSRDPRQLELPLVLPTAKEKPNA